jgi:hypothetical protein
VHGSQIDLRLASLFPRCVYGLSLELISQKVCPEWTGGYSVVNFVEILDSWQSYNFGFLSRCREVTESKAMVKQMRYVDKRSFWKVPETFIWNAINTTGLTYF